MGFKYVRRNRMEDLPAIDDNILASISMNGNINFEKYDEQQIYDKVNAQLDIQQAKINARPW